VSADLPTDIAITSLAFNADSAGSYEVEFGTGASGSETAIGAWRGQCRGATAGDEWHHPLYYGINVSARQRLSMRTRGTATSQALRTGLTVVPNPTFAQRTSATAKVFPPAANNVTVAGSNTDWANSGYVELSSAVASDVYIYNIAYTCAVGGIEFELDLATGAAASEVVLTTVRGAIVGSSSGQGWLRLPLPVPTKVTSGARLSIRVRKEGTDTQNLGFAVNYYGDVFA
jgi:hypothetical protein